MDNLTPNSAAQLGSKTLPPDFVYAGFWLRLWASLIDSVLVLIIVLPILVAIYGPGYLSSTRLLMGPIDFLINYVLPAIGIILFWIYRSATPGKMAIHARIVDAATLEKSSRGQLIGRYFGYYVSLLPLGLGFLWIAWDPRKQAWHDKLAGTVVVRYKKRR